ncbi:MAG: GDSL-like Lipase/Acylhydrolase [Verrucomicrobiaceae bacterium]|nr:GDSL-like Lipase/Acylhydrolase [Verrucomicrobiaceae bacterium]
MKTFSLLSLLLALSASGAEPQPLHLTLPPMWFGVPGTPVSLYYDNVVLTEKPESLKFEIKCDIGSSEAKRWTVTPTDKDVGDHAMQVTVKDSAGKVIEMGSTKLRIAPKDAGAGRELELLIVGDSLTAATIYPNEIARLLSEPGNPKWTMLSDHKPAGAKPGVAHEGYGGWTWQAFLARYVAKPEPEKRNISSPFVYADDKGKPGLDIPRYFKEHCGGQTPDVVTFLLGINDCFGAKAGDREAMDKVIDGALDNADKLIAAFHAAAPKAVFAVGLTTPPNSRESGFEANYHGKYHRWGWKQIQHRLVQRMLTRFGSAQDKGIYLVPTELNLDTVDGYADNNGVHPNATGYAQIGDSFYAWLKAWMASAK